MPTTEPSVTDRAGWVAAYLRRLELFGRQRRAGWTVLGNEVDRFAEMPTQREVTECGG